MASAVWRRHRRKILAAAAVGAAGAAAAYWWWYSAEEQEAAEAARREAQAAAILQAQGYGSGSSAAAKQQQEQQQGQEQQPGGAAAADPDGGEPAAGSLDESLAAHFASIQELSDRQALEELLPRLQDVLLQATDYEPLRQQLRAPDSGSLPSGAKLGLWRGLAGHSFVRALGGVWLVPLLDLLVRLKLHIVGRHMYLESKLPQLQPQWGAMAPGPGVLGGLGGLAGAPVNRLALPPCLSDRAKEEFFRCDFFIDVGAAGLLHKLRAAVERSLAGVDFAGSMSQQDLEALVISMHGAFEDSFSRAEDLWAAYLVPPGPAPVSVRTSGGVEALLSPVEAAMVDELNGELRQTLADFRFVEALRAAVRHTSRSMGAYVSSKVSGSSHAAQQQGQDSALQQQQQEQQRQPQDGAAHQHHHHHHHHHHQQQQRPFPYIVPVVAKSGQLLFDEAGRASKGISSLREVQALCASVFSFAPGIQ